jgi:integrase
MAEIHAFAARRLLDLPEGAATSSVANETYSLHALMHRAASLGGPETLAELSLQADLCARVLRDPGRVRAAYVREWWRALQAFLYLMAGSRSEAERRIAAIEERLIPRRTRDWDEAERVAGGHLDSAKRPSRLLFAEDLLAIVERAREGKEGEHAQRDAALVSLFCWSSLRSGEIPTLCWEDIRWEEARDDCPFTAWARCWRRGAYRWLPIHRRAADPLALLHAVRKRTMDRQPEGRIYRSLHRPYWPLSDREVYVILNEALSKAGLQASRRDLLAAYAYCLKTTHGYTVLDLREILGFGEPKVVRSLLRTHEAWRLNQKADALQGPMPL